MHNISLVRHISFVRCCADRTYISRDMYIYVRTISSFGFQLWLYWMYCTFYTTRLFQKPSLFIRLNIIPSHPQGPKLVNSSGGGYRGGWAEIRRRRFTNFRPRTFVFVFFLPFVWGQELVVWVVAGVVPWVVQPVHFKVTLTWMYNIIYDDSTGTVKAS